MNENYFNIFPGIDYEERVMLEDLMRNLTDDEKQKFLMIYQGRRQDSMNMLIFIVIGFFGVAGIHRLVMGEIAMGVLYLFTAGLCWIGTIVDLINYKSITYNYNRQKAMEVLHMMRLIPSEKI